MTTKRDTVCALHVKREARRTLLLPRCLSIADQGFLAKKVMSMDRGRNVQSEQAYRELARGIFDHVTSRIDTKPLRIPYIIVVLEYRK